MSMQDILNISSGIALGWIQQNFPDDLSTQLVRVLVYRGQMGITWTNIMTKVYDDIWRHWATMS